VNEKEVAFMATEPVDYPCSVTKEFNAARALAKGLLGELAPGVALTEKPVGGSADEGEPCAVIYAEDKSVGAVVFPTAQRLKDIESVAGQLGATLILNPQWSTGGNLVSDFGFGPWRKRAEDFLATFEPAYSLTEQRIGNPGSIDGVTGERFVNGGVVRTLRCYPGDWDVHCVIADGSNEFLASAADKPGYGELDDILREARGRGLDIFRRGREIWRGSTSGVAVTTGENNAGEGADMEGIGGADIDVMDKATLQRYLAARGLPTAGKLSSLRQRAKEAAGVA